MADKKGLEMVGVTFGLVTAIVVMIGGMVVKGHLDGRLSLDGGTSAGAGVIRPIAATVTGTVIR